MQQRFNSWIVCGCDSTKTGTSPRLIEKWPTMLFDFSRLLIIARYSSTLESFFCRARALYIWVRSRIVVKGPIGTCSTLLIDALYILEGLINRGCDYLRKRNNHITTTFTVKLTLICARTEGKVEVNGRLGFFALPCGFNWRFLMSSWLQIEYCKKIGRFILTESSSANVWLEYAINRRNDGFDPLVA